MKPPANSRPERREIEIVLDIPRSTRGGTLDANNWRFAMGEKGHVPGSIKGKKGQIGFNKHQVEEVREIKQITLISIHSNCLVLVKGSKRLGALKKHSRSSGRVKERKAVQWGAIFVFECSVLAGVGMFFTTTPTRTTRDRGKKVQNRRAGCEQFEKGKPWGWGCCRVVRPMLINWQKRDVSREGFKKIVSLYS